MNARHLIETMDFGLACAGPAPGLDDEQALARLLRDVLLPAVEQALAACDEPGTVLSLPALEIDLGTIPHADFHAEAARRLRTALLDALDGARRSAAGSALHGGAAANAATLHAETDGALAQLAGFLATGRLPWHAGLAAPATHVALLDRLLAEAAARLPALLAAVLAQPHGARRLAEQFPARQLRALLRLAAGSQADALAEHADAHRLTALLHAALLPGAPGTAVPAAAAGGDRAGAAARAGAEAGAEAEAGAGVEEVEAGAGAGAGAGAEAGAGTGTDAVAALAAFLRSGRLDAATACGAAGENADDPAMPLHARLFECALAGPVGALRAMLRQALAHAASARRLAEQFAAAQLAHLARRCAPRRAATLLAQLAPAAPPAAWRRLLAACVEDDADGVPAAAEDLARLAAFLCDGAPLPLAGAAAEALLARAIAAAAMDRGAALRQVLVRAGADGAAARLVQCFPAFLVVRLAERLAPARAHAATAWAHAVLADAARAGAATAQLRALAPLCWRCVLLAALEGRPLPPPALVHAAAGVAAGMAPASAAQRTGVASHGDAALAQLLAYLATGQAQGLPGATPAQLLERTLANATTPARPALAAALGRVLVGRQALRRLVDGMPAALLERLVEQAAPAHAGAVVAAMRLRLAAAARRGAVKADLARLRATEWEAALFTVLVRGGAAPALPLPPASAEAPASAPAPDRRGASARARWLSFLTTGRLPAPAEATPVALLDEVLAGADATLWPALATTLAAPAAMRRLLEQFPERQWRALVLRAQPAHGAALCALAGAVDMAGDAGASAWSTLLATAVAAADTALVPDAVRAASGGVAQGVTQKATENATREATHDIARQATREPTPAPTPEANKAPLQEGDGPADPVARLLQWLQTGVQPGSGSAAGPAALLAAAMAGTAAPARLRAALASALVRPAAARRLATLVSQEQLETLLWTVVPTAAAGAIDAVEEAQARAVARGATDARADSAAARCRLAAVGALLAPGGTMLPPGRGPAEAAAEAGATAPAASVEASPQAQLERLAVFLASGRLDLAAAPEGSAPVHVTLLDKLLDTLPDTLLAVLANALARPASGRRLIEQFPDRQLRAIVGLARPALHAALPAELALPTDHARQATWHALLAAALADHAPAAAMSGAAGFTGAGAGAHALWIDDLLAAPSPARWQALAAALRSPQAAARLVAGLPDRQLARIVQLAQPERGAQLLASLAVPAKAQGQARARRWHALLCAALAGRDDAIATSRLQPAAGEGGTAPAATGMAATEVVGSHATAPHIDWLDALMAAPCARLWATLAAALARPERAATLFARFPSRQLHALLRLARQHVPVASPAQAEDLAAWEALDGGRRQALLAAAVAGALRREPDAAAAAPAPVTERPAADAPAAAGAVPPAPAKPGAGPQPSGTADLLARLSTFLADAGEVSSLANAARHRATPLAYRAGSTPPVARPASLDEAAAQDGGWSGDAGAGASAHEDGQAGRARPGGMTGQPPGAGSMAGTALRALPAAPPLPPLPPIPPWRTAAPDGRTARAIRAVLRAAQAGAGAPAWALPVSPDDGAAAAAGDRPGACFAARVEVECARLVTLLAQGDAAAGTTLPGAAAPHAAIAAALTRGAGAEDWQRLLAERRPAVAGALRRLAGGPAARAALAAGLSDALLADLVAQLMPAGAPVAVPRDAGGPARQRYWRAALAAAVSGRPLCAPAALAVTPARMPATRWSAPPSAGVEAVAEGASLALLNAGMVLLAPYLPRLFAVLGLVADGKFTDTAAAERAALLLQFAASGEAGAPEYQLPLNKLMCGLAAEAPLPIAIDITAHERDTIGSLLGAVIETWSALGRTSVDGFRDAFLMRKGELLRGEEDWRLAVAPGPFDMLMDRLPWSFSIVRYPWMAQPIHVTWQRP